MTRSSNTLALLLCLTGCSGVVVSDPESMPPDEEERPPALPPETPPTPIAPGNVADACSVDRPHPRRALRLSSEELLRTYRAIAPLPDNTLPDVLRVSSIGSTPDASLAVARDLHESLEVVAKQLARAIAAQPGLSCPVDRFGADEACTRAFLQKQALAFFRGAESKASVDALVVLVRDIAVRSGPAAALEYGVRALALSAQTLYNSEGLQLQDGADAQKSTPLAPSEIAAFLSYRITGGPSSTALLTALEKSRTPSPTELRALIEQHFSVSERQAAAASFWASFLNVDVIPKLVRDPKKHPGQNADALVRLQSETTAALVTFAQKPDATWASALSVEQTSVLAGDASNEAAKTLGRPGLFLLPGVLASVSTTDHTDIPRRGRFLLRQLFCEEVPSPPANLLQSLPPLEGKPTERQRFERIEQEASCSGCHSRVNHLGFSLESYDEMGVARLRDENGQPIETGSAHTLDGYPDLVFKDARDLLAQAATHPIAQGCLALQVFRHFARRAERGSDDACLIRDVLRAASAGDFNLQDMFTDTLVRVTLAPRAN
jgi:Protein of unknown function (DUF1588)/Protein of unknown function (DUF1592)